MGSHEMAYTDSSMFEGKVAAIFGGAKGIGRAYCESLLTRNAMVCVIDVQDVAGKQTVNELQRQFGKTNVTFWKCDARSEEQVKEALIHCRQYFSRLDIVASTVGYIDETNWRIVADFNLGASIRITEAAMEILGKDKGGNGGVIVMTASNAGLIPAFLSPIYSATKAGLIQYLRALSHPANFKNHGVRMISICPTFTDTDFVTDFAKQESYVHDIEFVKKVTLYGSPQKMLKPHIVGEAMAKAVENESLNGVAVSIAQTTQYVYTQSDDYLGIMPF